MSTNAGVENTGAASTTRRRAAERVKAGLSTIGTALQKINLSKLIDDMEHDQELADKLEVFNKETDEEVERKRIVQEALAKCKAEMEDHLETFLFFHPEASYEEWIHDCHPENVSEGKILTDFKDVDLRFYVADSDHRLLWNSRVPVERHVAARSYKQAGNETVDLLNDLSAEESSGMENLSVSAEESSGTENRQAESSGDGNQLVDLLGDGWPAK